jgi:hypothetical protein
MKVNPTYSIEFSEVYHNNNKCTERNNIESRNVKQGTGGKRLCSHCKRLNEEGK